MQRVCQYKLVGFKGFLWSIRVLAEGQNCRVFGETTGRNMFLDWNTTRRVGRWVCCVMILMFLLACGHKEEKAEHKEESKHEEGDAKKDKEKKTEKTGEGGHGEDSKKDKGFDVVSPAIVAHLRIELNRETSEDKVLPITPIVEEVPKIATKEKAEVQRAPQPALQDMGYKTDKEYMALRRFELPSSKEEKKPEKRIGAKEEPDTIGTREKILVLGGKGSDIQSFRSKATDSMAIDINRRLIEPLPEEPPKKERPHLDLKEDNIKNKRSLIFHQQGSGFFKVEEPGKKDEVLKPAPPKATSPALERVPETQLLFSQSKDNQLILKPREGELDLLLGNEDFNRRAFEAERKSNK